MDRIAIAAIFADQDRLGGQTVTLRGWARTIRDMKTFGFIELNDGSCFKNLQVVMDAGALEAESAFQAGADLVTVLAVTDLSTVRACVEAAEAWGRRVVADMICVADLEGRARRLEEAGVHGIAVHTGVDQQLQGRTPLSDLSVLRRAVERAEVSAAGGIGLSTLPEYCAQRPDVLIVGGAIASASDPAAEARAIRQAMTRWEEKNL